MRRMKSVWYLSIILFAGISCGLLGNLGFHNNNLYPGSGVGIAQAARQLSKTAAPSPIAPFEQTRLAEQQHNLGMVIGVTVLLVIILAGMVIFSWRKKSVSS